MRQTDELGRAGLGPPLAPLANASQLIALYAVELALSPGRLYICRDDAGCWGGIWVLVRGSKEAGSWMLSHTTATGSLGASKQ